MPPNSNKLPIAECANVYKDEGGQVAKRDLIQNGNPSAFHSLRREEDRHVELRQEVDRSRHRYTYELDKFQKNAMLVFQYDSYPGSRILADKVKDTFEKFRFEVEVHRNATRYEVFSICKAFFQRDFHEIGAVGIVVVAQRNYNGDFIAPESMPGSYLSDSNFSEKDIRNYLSKFKHTEKPKIFLVQADNYAYFPEDRYRYCNMFEMHLPPSPSCGDLNSLLNNSCPLNLLCDKMDELSDLESFPNIALATIADLRKVEREQQRRDIESQLPYAGSGAGFTTISRLPPSRIQYRVYYKMSKHLYFWRNSSSTN